MTHKHDSVCPIMHFYTPQLEIVTQRFGSFIFSGEKILGASHSTFLLKILKYGKSGESIC